MPGKRPRMRTISVMAVLAAMGTAVHAQGPLRPTERGTSEAAFSDYKADLAYHEQFAEFQPLLSMPQGRRGQREVVANSRFFLLPILMQTAMLKQRADKFPLAIVYIDSAGQRRPAGTYSNVPNGLRVDVLAAMQAIGELDGEVAADFLIRAERAQDKRGRESLFK